nr:MAG TPA: hypothetical protein [Caudoviricetes sp.]
MVRRGQNILSNLQGFQLLYLTQSILIDYFPLQYILCYSLSMQYSLCMYIFYTFDISS